MERPFVYVNVAATLDGKLAPENRHFVPFSSSEDQELLLQLRTDADAVMAGARTVDLGKVSLSAENDLYRALRKRKGHQPENVRVIISGHASLNPDAHIFRSEGGPIIVIVTTEAPPAQVKRLEKVADQVMAFGKDQIDFRQTLHWLWKQWKIRSLLCEGGGELNSALFRQGVVDRLYLTLSPVIFGGAHAPTLADGKGVDEIKDAIRLNLRKLRRRKGDLFLIYDVVHA